jgi:hypothetical protein
MKAEVVLPFRVGFGEHGDVGARAEELLTRPADHDDMDAAVHARIKDGGVDVPHHLV